MYSEILNEFRLKNYKKVTEFPLSEDVRVLEIKALALMNLKTFNQASKLYEEVLNIKNTPQNYYHAALANMENNNFKVAIKYYEKVKDEKLITPSRINTAYCMFKLEKNKDAILLLKQCLKRKPTIQQGWFLLLKYYRKKEDVNELISVCKQSKEYIQHSLEWVKSYVYYNYIKKKHNKVVGFLKENQHKNDKYISGILAKSLIKEGQIDKAIKIYKKQLINEDSVLNNYNLSAGYSCLTTKENLKDSLKYIRKTLVLDSTYHKAYFCEAIVWQKLNRFEKSKISINKAINLDSNNEDYLYVEAEIYKQLGKPKKALRIINKLLKINSKNNLVLRLKGIIKLQQNKAKSSEKILKQAIKLDTTDQRAIAYFAIAKYAQNKELEVKNYLSLSKFVKEYKINEIENYQNVSDFNHDLERDIKHHSLLRKEPYGLAARNGYLTDDLFFDKTKSICAFKKALLTKINQYIDELPTKSKHHMLRHKTKDFKINSWATWVKGDGYIDKHIHEESWLSGAYYCKVPKTTMTTEDKQGYFEYGCIPNDLNLSIKKKKGYVQPVEGKLVIFPSYLYHQTIPHETSESRISIAFDLTPNNWNK